MIIIISVGSFFGVIVLLLSTVFFVKHCSKDKKGSSSGADEELQPTRQPEPQPQQQAPMVMAVGIPVMAAQGYNQGYNQPMGGPLENPMMPAAPMYNMPPLNFSQLSHS